MPVVKVTHAQADDPIYKSGLVMSFHRESKESTLNISELSESLKNLKDVNTLDKEKEASTKESSS